MPQKARFQVKQNKPLGYKERQQFKAIYSFWNKNLKAIWMKMLRSSIIATDDLICNSSRLILHLFLEFSLVFVLI